MLRIDFFARIAGQVPVVNYSIHPRILLRYVTEVVPQDMSWWTRETWWQVVEVPHTWSK